MSTQSKIREKLINTARDFGYHDAAFSIYDCSESMNKVQTSMTLGEELADLLELDFYDFVENDSEGNEAYIQGYVSAISTENDLPEDLNEGGPSSLNACLSEASQARIRELVANQ